MPHKATDTTSEQPETVCIAEPLVYESVTAICLFVVLFVTINHQRCLLSSVTVPPNDCRAGTLFSNKL